MAVCEIWDVKGRLDHPIDYAENPEKTANPKYTDADLQAISDVMKYATNGDKTEKQFFVTGVNCDSATARDEMMIAKRQWNDESEIVCYHGFQSFKAGEVTPEQAHEVGVKLAEKMWGDRFQVVVATHLNTECLHNHFVVNSMLAGAGHSHPRDGPRLQAAAWTLIQTDAGNNADRPRVHAASVHAGQCRRISGFLKTTNPFAV